MNNANRSTPACQDQPDRAHQRRNNAIECASAFVVDSAASRPNRRCRRYSSATPTTCRSSSSTVQYRCPDGKLTGNARMASRFLVDSHKRLPATSTTPPEKRRKTDPIIQIEQRHATDQETPEKGRVSVRTPCSSLETTSWLSCFGSGGGVFGCWRGPSTIWIVSRSPFPTVVRACRMDRCDATASAGSSWRVL